MPTIRVDDDVYEELRNRGKTGDSFSDVLRPLLHLPRKAGPLIPVGGSSPLSAFRREVRGLADQVSRQLGSPKSDAGDVTRLEQIVSRHLPSHWSDAPKHVDQILSVVAHGLSQPPGKPIHRR